MAKHLHDLDFPEDLLEVLFIQLSLINDLYGNLEEGSKRSHEEGPLHAARPGGIGKHHCPWKPRQPLPNNIASARALQPSPRPQHRPSQHHPPDSSGSSRPQAETAFSQDPFGGERLTGTGRGAPACSAWTSGHAHVHGGQEAAAQHVSGTPRAASLATTALKAPTANFLLPGSARPACQRGPASRLLP